MTARTNDDPAAARAAHPPRVMLEIERKYLLRRRPQVPPQAVVVRIDQGYLRPDPGDAVREGRLRRVEYADGRLEYIHTVKTGRGLVREERERPITAGEFERLWPRTEGARLRKTRYRVPLGPERWVVDVFDDLDLMLAEVEIPEPDHDVQPPDWLAGCIEREVTGEDAYRNFVLSQRIARGG